MTHGGERPVEVKVRVAAMLDEQLAHRARRRGQSDFHVATATVRGSDVERGVLDAHQHIAGDGERARHSRGAAVRDRIDQAGLSDLLCGLRAEIGPSIRQRHGGLRIDQTGAVVVVEVVARAVRHPVGVRGVHLRGAAQQDFLHITPAERGIAFQQQGHHAGGQRRGRGGAAKGMRVTAVRGGRGDAAMAAGDVIGRRTHEHVGPRFRIGAAHAGIVHRGHGDGVDRVRVAVVVRVVLHVAAIACGPEPDGSFAAASGGGSAGQRLLHQGAGVAEIGAVVARAPGVAVEMNDVVFPVQGRRFIRIADARSDEAQAHQRGVRCGTGDAETVVSTCTGHARAGRAVRVGAGVTRRVIRRRVIPVVIVHRVRIGGQIGMRHLEAVVHDAHADAGAGEAVPHGSHIHVDACRAR